jgi:acyl-CoA synthetase (AMP-forming)/AMP-acid ligase II
VRSIARGLLSLDGLSTGSFIAIAGYNDFEFACADFACAVAGMVPVGLHGTYEDAVVCAAINKVSRYPLKLTVAHQRVAKHSRV